MGDFLGARKWLLFDSLFAAVVLRNVDIFKKVLNLICTQSFVERLLCGAACRQPLVGWSPADPRGRPLPVPLVLAPRMAHM